MSWTFSQINILIDEYKKYTSLYIVKDKAYHNKHKRMACLTKIAQALHNAGRVNTTEVEVLKKITGLRNTFTTERRKVLESSLNGRGPDEIYTPSLWYYNHLMFLKDQVHIRATKSNFVLVSPSASPDVPLNELSEEEIVDFKDESSDYQPKQEPASNDEAPSGQPASNAQSTDDEAPPTSFRRRKRKAESADNTSPVLAEASKCLRSISNGFQHHSPVISRETKTEDDLYGEYVTSRLKSITNPRTKLELKHDIDNLFFHAAISIC